MPCAIHDLEEERYIANRKIYKSISEKLRKYVAQYAKTIDKDFRHAANLRATDKSEKLSHNLPAQCVTPEAGGEISEAVAKIATNGDGSSAKEEAAENFGLELTDSVPESAPKVPAVACKNNEDPVPVPCESHISTEVSVAKRKRGARNPDAAGDCATVFAWYQLLSVLEAIRTIPNPMQNTGWRTRHEDIISEILEELRRLCSSSS